MKKLSLFIKGLFALTGVVLHIAFLLIFALILALIVVELVAERL